MKRFFSLLLFALLCLAAFFLVSCSIGDIFKSRANKAPGLEPSPDARIVGLYPANTNTLEGQKWGYIDKTGKFVIKPSFKEARDFDSDGLAVVNGGKGYGVINTDAKYIVEPKYNYISDFTDKRAVAEDNTRQVVLDETGNIVFEIPQKDGYILNFSDGMAAVGKNLPEGTRYGYINTAGQMVIEPKYMMANPFEDGKALVRTGEGKYSLINKEGFVINNYEHYMVGNYGDGLMSFMYSADSLQGYINEAGKVAIEPRFSSASAFSKGLAVVGMSPDYNSMSGVINKQGKFVIKPQYSTVNDLDEGMFGVGIPIDPENAFKGSKFAIANKTGKILTDFIYYGINNYKNGISSADNGSITYFIDKKGERVQQLPGVKGIGSLTLEDGLIKADIDNRTSYLDVSGKLLWKPNKNIPVKDSISLVEHKYMPARSYLVYYPQIAGMPNKDTETALNKKLKEMSIPDQVAPGAELDYSYEGDFTTEFYKKNLLVLELTGYKYPYGAAHGMPRMDYAHVDIGSGAIYELKDLFKKDSDYVKKISDIVAAQIKAKGDEMGIWPDSYKGIKPDQPFFINDKALNIYFYPYEIAPYAAGFPTFSIPYAQISDIIDKKGEFWKSFN